MQTEIHDIERTGNVLTIGGSEKPVHFRMRLTANLELVKMQPAYISSLDGFNAQDLMDKAGKQLAAVWQKVLDDMFDNDDEEYEGYIEELKKDVEKLTDKAELLGDLYDHFESLGVPCSSDTYVGQLSELRDLVDEVVTRLNEVLT